MDLTEQQQRTIKEWAARTSCVAEVRLFGSRAKGGARPDSDVDLAITIGGPDLETIRGHYCALGQKWQDELTRELGLRVHVNHYNEPADDTVQRHCDEFSVMLYP